MPYYKPVCMLQLAKTFILSMQENYENKVKHEGKISRFFPVFFRKSQGKKRKKTDGKKPKTGFFPSLQNTISYLT